MNITSIINSAESDSNNDIISFSKVDLSDETKANKKRAALEKYTTSAASANLNDDVDDEFSKDDQSYADKIHMEEDLQQEIASTTKSIMGEHEEFEDDHLSIKLTDTAPSGLPAEEEQQQQHRTPLQRRLHELQMRMNQSRQLNRKEVLHEGEQQQQQHQQPMKETSSRDGGEKKEYSTSKVKRQIKNTMMEPAYESMRRASQKQRRAEQNQFAVNDYYNPEGQFRNYERNLKSLPKHKSENYDGSTYDPLLQGVASTSTAYNNNLSSSLVGEGAHRLAEEMRRRIEKKKATKRKAKDIIEGDVNYINERNKQFNKKIARNFDKYTAEIRHNLERGTAS
jgi:pre-mRNA-splicing factor SYF2